MYADEESDEGIVPMKRSNKEDLPSAETVEGRASPEENDSEHGSLLDGRQRITKLEWRPGQHIRIANCILELDFVDAEAALSQSTPEPVNLVVRRVQRIP